MYRVVLIFCLMTDAGPDCVQIETQERYGTLETCAEHIEPAMQTAYRALAMSIFMEDPAASIPHVEWQGGCLLEQAA